MKNILRTKSWTGCLIGNFLCIYRLISFVVLFFISGLAFGQTYPQIPSPYVGSWDNTEYNTTEGTEFWVTFVFNSGANDDQNNLSLYLYATSREDADVQVRNPFTGETNSFHVEANDFARFKISNGWAYVNKENEVLEKSIYVKSTKPISLYATSHHSSGKYDGTNVLPVSALVGSYEVQTFMYDTYSSEFAIVAAEDATIDIHVQFTIYNKETPKDSVFYDTTLILSRGEVYLFRSAELPIDKKNAKASLTGTTLCSRNGARFAVFQGGQALKIPSGKDPENHIFHQAYPTDQFGKKFFVTPTYSASYDYVLITATSDGTKLKKNGEEVCTLQKGKTYIDTISEVSIYETNHAAQCYLYGIGYALNKVELDENILNCGAPVMTPIVPQEYGMDSVIFTTFAASTTTQPTLYHFVNVVTKTDRVGTIYLDNKNRSSDFKPISYDPSYSYAIFKIDSGAHTLANRDKHIDGKFTARVYGLGEGSEGKEAYAYSAGSRIERPADVLINGEYIKEADICITDPATFTPIINYDFDSYEWVYSKRNENYPYGYANPNIGSSESRTNIEDYQLTFPSSGDWTMNLVVKMTTPLCNNTIIDTVKVMMHVHDTASLDELWEGEQVRTLCYGDTFSVHYGKTHGRHSFRAITDSTQNFKGKATKFEIDSIYSVVDTFTTIWGCDSIMKQRFVIRPAYNLTEHDTICVSDLNDKTKTYDKYDTQGNHETLTFTLTDAETTSLKRTKTGTIKPVIKEDSVLLQTIYGCDSMVHVRLVVLPTYSITETVPDQCMMQGGKYEWKGHTDKNGNVLPGHNLYTHGTYEVYDTVHYYDYYYHNSTYRIDTIRHTGWHRVTSIPLSTSGTFTYRDSLHTHGCQRCGEGHGCDSVYILRLTIKERITHPQSATQCDDRSVVWKVEGVFDSLFVGKHYDLANLPDQYKNNYRRVGSGTLSYEKPAVDDIHCPELYTMTIRWNTTYDTLLQVKQLCVNQLPYEWRCEDNGELIQPFQLPDNSTLPLDTTLTARLTTKSGCDSVVNLPLHIYPTYQHTVYDTVCETDMPYQLNSKTDFIPLPTNGLKQEVWTTEATYILESKDGCDSIVTLHLTVLPTLITELNPIICPSELPYKFNKGTQSLLQAGDTSFTVTSKQFGCDSIVKIHLTVREKIDLHSYATICNNMLPFNYDTIANIPEWKNLTTSGPYIHTFTNEYGCQGTHTLHLTVKDTTIATERIYLCRNELPYTDKHFTDIISYNDTTYIKRLTNQAGCDSVVTVQIIVGDTYDKTEEEPIRLCDNDNAPRTFTWSNYDNGQKRQHTTTLRWNKLQQIMDTTLIDTLHTSFKLHCDSIRRLHIIIYPTYQIDSTQTICEGDSIYWENEWRKGKPQTRTEGATFPELGETEYVSQTYSVRYDALNGCDSVYTLTLNVIPRRYTHIDKAICDYENYRFGDYIHHHEAGIYYDTLRLLTTTEPQCDSIVTLRLTVNPSFHNDTTIEICDNEAPDFVYSFGVKEYRFNQMGRLDHQHILRIDTALTTPSSQTCDSAMRLHLIVYPTYRIDSTRTICEGDSTWWQGEWQKGKLQDRKEGADFPEYGSTEYVSETYSKRYDALNSCDSVHTLTLHVIPRRYTHIDTAICDYENYRFGDYIHHHEAGIYYDTLRLLTTTEPQCDSIVTLRLTVNPSFHNDTTIEICDNEAPSFVYQFGIKEYRFNRTDQLDHKTILKIDTALTTPSSQKCDSAMRLHLIVYPTYRIDSTRTICEGDSTWWQGEWQKGKLQDRKEGADFPEYGSTEYVSETYSKRYDALNSCDSVHTLTLHVIPRRYTHIDTAICDYDNYLFGDHLHQHEAGIYYDTLRLLTTTDPQCDSIVTLRLTVNPSFHNDTTIEACDDILPYTFNYNGDNYTFTQTEQRVLRTTSSKECDSVLVLNFIVHPTYHFDSTRTICESDSVSWQGIWYSGSRFSAYHPNGHDIASYKRTRENLQAETYHDTVRYQTIYGCDSIYCLTLHVHAVKDTTIYDRICQNEMPYEYKNLHNGKGGTLTQTTVGEYMYVDTISTAQGCDSIITFIFNIDSVYDYRQYEEVCQDTVNFLYEWIDQTTNNKQGDIDISEAGTFSFTKPFETIHGCDSVYGITLRVKPIYRFDSLYSICQNERIQWQGRWYAADKAIAEEGDRILTVGTFCDTTYYLTDMHCDTCLHCDSTYYLQLQVNPIYDTTTYMSICYTDTVHWLQKDRNGEYDTLVWAGKLQDTLVLSTIAALQPQESKIDTTFYFERMLQSKDGCDSLCHLVATVYPTYFFYTDTTICSNEHAVYRGKIFSSHDTTYYERYKSVNGCDSIYCFHLHVKPAYRFHRTKDICDNDTLFHSKREDIIWKPGDDIPNPLSDTIELHYFTEEGCDSIYVYHVFVHPTFLSDTTDTLCSNGHYLLQGEHWVGADTVYDTNVFIQPFDTVFTDSLQTIHGCDSIYRVTLHITPAYRHIDYDTICENETYSSWRNHTILRGANYMTNTFPTSGEWSFYDTYRTTYGCDSIYELRLFVHPIFSDTTYETICANEYSSWRNHRYNKSDTYIDSFTTIHGCDSIFYLYLTVLDTTNEFIYDTICENECYMLHGRPIYQSGFYKDTTKNAWGCDHYTYLYLTVIPPTGFTFYLSDICADEETIDIHYRYVGRPPIAYSVYFDSIGHREGFQDIHYSPISDPTAQLLQIPVSRKEVLPHPTPTYFDTKQGIQTYTDDDRYGYPLPYHYHFTVEMYNDICGIHSECGIATMRQDTTINLLYPSWIHEQHWNDGIVLYNDIYNGGYEFSHYQWYYNDQPIIGQTREFLYWPDSLHLNMHGKTGEPCANEYKVQLTRKSDGYTTFTCPICPVRIYDHIVPQKEYFAIVPTLVVRSNPLVWILSTEPGYYTVYNEAGVILQGPAFFTPDKNNYGGEIHLPYTIDTFLIIRLCTRAGDCRTFKILIVE